MELTQLSMQMEITNSKLVFPETYPMEAPQVIFLTPTSVVIFVWIENLYSLRPNLFRGNKAMGEIKFRLCIHLLFSIYFQFSYLTGYLKRGYIDTEAWRILNMCYGRKKGIVDGWWVILVFLLFYTVNNVGFLCLSDFRGK
ncbi:hypothetical protein LXL04_009315 [Taraxacum kok-saghyz]